ncbi:MAG TPA: sensor domain-containing phosphodiesterase, partial [Syntrophomonas sp.]|nr:sensor domain-containing phosphodiesterase [Syntrophomonas sp.]
VNDTMGHELGDQLLFEVAQILSHGIRSSDMIARFGGDEFIILLNDITSEKDVMKILDKLIDMLSKPILLNGQTFSISVSVGVALYPQDGTDAKTLIKNADIAMYNAKTRGKNRYLLCSQD